MNDQSPDLDLSTSADATRGPISRRTVIAGTAFAVPAIVLTAGTPALAASGVTLAFDKSAYSGAGCSTISGAKVSATQAGTPKAGVAVTVSLANGYTFDGGGTTSTSVTGSGGSVTLPDINVPVAGGSSTASATASGATSSSASLSGTAAVGAVYLDAEIVKNAVGVPAGSIPVSSAMFLASDGRLIDGGNNGAVLATNVDSFGSVFISDSQGTWYLPLKKKDGTFSYLGRGTENAAPNIPAGSSPVSASMFLTPDGRLLDAQNNGRVYASNIDSCGDVFISNAQNTWYMPLKKRDGSFTYLGNNQENAASGIPSGSTPVASAMFLSPDGRLMEGQRNGNVLASNIDSYGKIFISDNQGTWYMPLKKRDGSFTYLGHNRENAAAGIPSDSTPVASAMFLSPDGRLMEGQKNGNVLATGVVNNGEVFISNNQGKWLMPLNGNKPSC